MLDPISLDCQLPCSPTRAFVTYVERIGEWWDPAYTRDPSTLVTVRLEPHFGGRFYASHLDGDDVWGRIMTYEPGQRLVHTFTLALPPGMESLIGVTFLPTPTGCAMHFEHGGWTVDNVEFRAKYTGWRGLIDRFAGLATG